MFAAGLPIVVSSTWHVIGGFFSLDMLDAVVEGLGELESWKDRASMRFDAVLGLELVIRICVCVPRSW